MEQRQIGDTLVGELGLGCMGLSQSYGPSDDNESLRVLDRAIELGCNFWDTADAYGAGKNELLLAHALKKHRGKVFLATKVGNVKDRTLTSHQDQVKEDAPWIVDGTPKYIRKSAELSLHQQLSSAKTPTDKTYLQLQIMSTDAQIDVLVYELYRLTEEEIRLVESRSWRVFSNLIWL